MTRIFSLARITEYFAQPTTAPCGWMQTRAWQTEMSTFWSAWIRTYSQGPNSIFIPLQTRAQHGPRSIAIGRAQLPFLKQTVTSFSARKEWASSARPTTETHG